MIGGYNKKKEPSKEIWIYERAYNTMRAITNMKKGRVGHCVVSYSTHIPKEVDKKVSNSDEEFDSPNKRKNASDFFYIFGGKDVSILERVNIKMRSVEYVSDFKKNIVGCSGVEVNNSLYFFGGMCEY